MRGFPVTGFDHHSDEHCEDPPGAFARERAEHPVAWTEAHGGFWVLTDWEGVEQVAGDDTFSSARGPSGGEGLAIVIPAIERMVRDHIARCRREPCQGVIANLVAAEIGGRALSDDEVYSMSELLITELRNGTALEELLRTFSPTQALARTVTREVEVEGCRFTPGGRRAAAGDGG